jgi:Lhr-like helicase
MTERLEKHLRKECFPRPFTELAISHGISVDTIRDIMDEEIDKFEAFRAKTPLQAPRMLGIDEKHSGRIARGTLVDIENCVLLDIMENNKKETMKAAIMRLK